MADTDQDPGREDDAESPEPAVRAPENFGEMLAANLRPHPAIPAMLVLLFTIVIPVMSHEPGVAAGGGSLLSLLIPVGIVASCGLAIAAGFCSLFPQAAWILVALWALKFTDNGALPAYNRYVLIAGMIAAAAMIVAQVWRVRTGRFTPTIRIED